MTLAVVRVLRFDGSWRVAIADRHSIDTCGMGNAGGGDRLRSNSCGVQHRGAPRGFLSDAERRLLLDRDTHGTRCGVVRANIDVEERVGRVAGGASWVCETISSSSPRPGTAELGSQNMTRLSSSSHI